MQKAAILFLLKTVIIRVPKGNVCRTFLDFKKGNYIGLVSNIMTGLLCVISFVNPHSISASQRWLPKLFGIELNSYLTPEHIMSSIFTRLVQDIRLLTCKFFSFCFSHKNGKQSMQVIDGLGRRMTSKPAFPVLAICNLCPIKHLYLIYSPGYRHV